MLTAKAAFRDRNAGRESNRSRPTEEGIGRGSRRGGFRGKSQLTPLFFCKAVCVLLSR